MKKVLILLGLLFILALTACTPSTSVEDCTNETCTNYSNVSTNDSEVDFMSNESIDSEMNDVDEQVQTSENTTQPRRISQTYLEGDFIKLEIYAEDADNDELTYTYSAPFDENGEWQSEIGDAGIYDVTIVASDGTLDTSVTVTIELESVNSKPVITNFDSVSVIEGQKVTFQPIVTDEDGDDITLTYSGWISTDSYTTTFDDAGEYEVTLTADDGKETVSETVSVVVQNVNRRPIVESISDVSLFEGETVEIDVNAADPDGDFLTYEFSKPLSEDGTWETQVGDADKYSVTVSVSDGEIATEETFTIEVLSLNAAPVIENVEDIVVNEGETITFEPVVTDADNDSVTVEYSGWMDSASYTTTFEDAGEYEVTITADDGQVQSYVTVTVTVMDVNRAPVFVFE